MTFTVEYDDETFTTTLTLTGPGGLVPLPIGSYQLTIDGTTSIHDLAGNPLNNNSDFVDEIRVIGTEDPLNDRLVDAVDTGILESGGTFSADGAIGDNAFGNLDVDLYEFEARAGLQVTAIVRDRSIGSPLFSRVRLFNSAGTQLAVASNGSIDDQIVFNTTVNDTYPCCCIKVGQWGSNRG